MLLFRIVFWLGLFVLLLPTDERQQAKLYETASATVERVTTFCDRNPNACAAGAEFWATFVKKAEFGARAVVDLINSRERQPTGAVPTPASRPSGPTAAEARPGPASRGTLTREDLGPPWRGQPSRTGA